MALMLQTPVTKHFRNTSIEELDAIKRKEFRELLLIDIPLPAVTIRMYDEYSVCAQRNSLLSPTPLWANNTVHGWQCFPAMCIVSAFV